jgi:DNA polymerase I-like protein with 3'-5' exonuclease and polymerase domains
MASRKTPSTALRAVPLVADIGVGANWDEAH